MDQPELKESIAAHIAEVHSSVEVINERYRREERRSNYTTPKIFLGLIDLYQKLLTRNKEEAEKRRDNLGRGLNTMKLTSEKVAVLQKDLDIAKAKLAVEQKNTDVLVAEVTEKNAHAEAENKLAQQDAAEASETRKEAEILKAQAEEEYSKARPLVEKAAAAAKNLSQKSIGEMKAFPQPPLGVEIAGFCMYILLEKKQTNNWNDVKNKLNMPKQIIQKCLDYKGENIPDNIVEKTIEIYKGDAEAFKKSAKAACAAAGDIAEWVKNMITYNKMNRKIEPLMKTRDEAEEKLRIAEAAVEA